MNLFVDLPGLGATSTPMKDLLAAHDELIRRRQTASDRARPGPPLAEESHALYLYGWRRGPVPLSESDLPLLALLAALHVTDVQPDAIPLRECRVLVNRARLDDGLAVDVDTPVDVLRLACALSDGDVNATTPTKLRSLRRAERLRAAAALDAVVRDSPAKVADVARHAEPFKRLGERLHPHEYPSWAVARDAFAVARESGSPVRSRGGSRSRSPPATSTARSPSSPTRRACWCAVSDRLARAGADLDALVAAVRAAAPAVLDRACCSRCASTCSTARARSVRVFVNQRSRTWVTATSARRCRRRRSTRWRPCSTASWRVASTCGAAVVDPAVRSLAVPLTAKGRPDGLGILPRGSVQPLARHVRFFVLEAARAGDRLRPVGTAARRRVPVRRPGVVDEPLRARRGALGRHHRGAGGATEFIDLDLDQVTARYVIPQVNVYSGEGFDAVEEVFFGFMERTPDERGGRSSRARCVPSPTCSEAAACRCRCSSRVRMSGRWSAKWMHLGLGGHPQFNRVEGNARSASRLVRAIAERRYLELGYLEGLLRAGGATVSEWPVDSDQPVTFLGLERPDELPAGSVAYTPANLGGAAELGLGAMRKLPSPLSG